jgi:hypothetical protein
MYKLKSDNQLKEIIDKISKEVFETNKNKELKVYSKKKIS